MGYCMDDILFSSGVPGSTCYWKCKMPYSQHCDMLFPKLQTQNRQIHVDARVKGSELDALPTWLEQDLKNSCNPQSSELLSRNLG